MKIGIDIRNIGKKRTGDEVVFFNLVRSLAEIDNKNEYLLFTDITDTAVLQHAGERIGIKDKENFEIVSLECSNKFVWNFWTLPNYLRKNPIDIYHTQYITPFFVPKKIKIVTIVHDISFNFFSKFIKFTDLFFLRILMPLSLKRADKIVGVSEFTRDEIIKYYKINPEKVDYIHNAVGGNFPSKSPSDEQLEEVRKKYGLPEKFILYVGTLQPRKNIPFLLEAYSKVEEKIGDMKVVLIGNKDAHNFDKNIDGVIDRKNLHNKIIFPGYVESEDLPGMYRLADMFIFPSLYEGFGIPVLEAMSQKIPVIASSIPSLREIAGNAALFFNPRDLDDLSEKMYNILVDEKLKQDLIDLGSRRVGFFSWQKTAEKMLKIYNKL